MSKSKQELKNEILNKVREYYTLFHCLEPYKKDDKINYAGRIYNENEMINLVNCTLDFWLTAKDYVKTFEHNLANFLQVRHCLMVNSGSSSNLLAFYSLTSHLLKKRAIQRGDEVITLAAAFPTTIAPIVQFGAIPVFVDIDIKTHNINTNELEKALSSKTKAVLIAHTLGIPFDISKVKDFCDKYNLWLIEDNCDALGAKYKGRFTGTIGDIGTSSFYPAHHITTGEGGAVYTNNSLLHKIALSMRDWGRECWCEGGKDNTCGKRFSGQFAKLPFGYDHKYVYSHFGFNLKATEMQAAIGVAQLEKLANFIQKRKDNHQYLYQGLSHLTDFLNLPHIDDNASPFGFIINVKDTAPFSRNDIVQFLETKQIQTRNLFAGNMLCQIAFESLQKDIDYRVIGDLAHTNKAMNNSFWIGVYPGLKTEHLDYMIDSIQEFIQLMGGGHITT